MQPAGPVHRLTELLLNSVNDEYVVTDPDGLQRVLSDLEAYPINYTELMETRIGKHVNEVRRRSNDKALSKRIKALVKVWQQVSGTQSLRINPGQLVAAPTPPPPPPPPLASSVAPTPPPALAPPSLAPPSLAPPSPAAPEPPSPATPSPAPPSPASAAPQTPAVLPTAPNLDRPNPVTDDERNEAQLKEPDLPQPPNGHREVLKVRIKLATNGFHVVNTASPQEISDMPNGTSSKPKSKPSKSGRHKRKPTTGGGRGTTSPNPTSSPKKPRRSEPVTGKENGPIVPNIEFSLPDKVKTTAEIVAEYQKNSQLADGLQQSRTVQLLQADMIEKEPDEPSSSVLPDAFKPKRRRPDSRLNDGGNSSPSQPATGRRSAQASATGSTSGRHGTTGSVGVDAGVGSRENGAVPSRVNGSVYNDVASSGKFEILSRFLDTVGTQPGSPSSPVSPSAEQSAVSPCSPVVDSVLSPASVSANTLGSCAASLNEQLAAAAANGHCHVASADDDRDVGAQLSGDGGDEPVVDAADSVSDGPVEESPVLGAEKFSGPLGANEADAAYHKTAYSWPEDKTVRSHSDRLENPVVSEEAATTELMDAAVERRQTTIPCHVPKPNPASCTVDELRAGLPPFDVDLDLDVLFDLSDDGCSSASLYGTARPTEMITAETRPGLSLHILPYVVIDQ